MSEYRHVATQKLEKIFGPVSENIREHFDTVAPDFMEHVDYVYGNIYNRPGLDDKTREIAVVACLIGQGFVDEPLKAHVEGMLNTGWKQSEVHELLLFLSPFVGLPAITKTINYLEKNNLIQPCSQSCVNEPSMS